MGAVNSCCIPRRHGNECRENHAVTPKIKGHKRNLSATFNMAAMVEEDNECQNQNLLNINIATEEELMTLPGINRPTAQNILDYRKQIMGFRKVEDLALVSGVGATKLSHIRQEICVSIKKSNSKSGSPDGSNQDLMPNNRETRKMNGTTFVKVNINSSNVFQIMKVKGLGQNLSENIVAYRDKKGCFKSIDDLVKVKGIGPALLSAIRYQVTLDLPSDNDSHSSGPNPPVMNGRIPHVLSRSSNGSNVDSKSSMENLLECFGPLSKKPVRPNVNLVSFMRNNRTVSRIASWNLQQCSVEKAENPGVREIICMTILENGFRIIAFQELADTDALEKICDELNNPVIPNIKKWKADRGTWKCAISGVTGRMYQSNEYNGYLYDTSRGVELINTALLHRAKASNRSFTRKPFFGIFKINHLDCVLVTVHLKAKGLRNEDLGRLQKEIDKVADLVEAVEEQFPGEKDTIILGDFNINPDNPEFSSLRDHGYSPCIEDGTYTNISNANYSGSSAYDNIWFGEQTKTTYTGYHGVVRDGLTHPWIPNGWTWGGVVSDHCPVWAEVYTNKDHDQADLTEGHVIFTI